MDVEGAIEESATGTSAAILLHGCTTCVYHALVTSKSCICIRTEHEDVMPSHLYFSTLFAFNFTEIGIYAFILYLFR